MAEDNVALLQKTYDAFGRGDIPAVMATFAEDITWHSPAILPQGGDEKGHEGVGKFFQRLAHCGRTFSSSSTRSSPQRTACA